MALIYSNTNNFWIKPNALNIGLNHFDNPNLIEVSLLAGAVIMAYKQDVIAFNAAHNYRTWQLNASRTFLEQDERCYVYARLDRAETSNYAQVVYSYQELDMLGRATEDATATEYYYILLGVLSPAVGSDGNKVDRTWEEGFYTGSLATDQYIKEESGGDWTKMFSLNGVTGFIDVLKTISSATINALKVVTSFSLAGKIVKGIDDSTSDTSSDDHLATSGYVDANALSSKTDDTAQGKITFAQGVNIGSQDITDIDVAEDVPVGGYADEDVTDNSVPSTSAMVLHTREHGDANYLSKVKDDSAEGKITFKAKQQFDQGFEVGEYKDGDFGTGGVINVDEYGNSYLEVDYGKFRKKVTFNDLEIKSLKHVGGTVLLSPASATLAGVVSKTDGYACYFRKTDGEGKSVKNEWQVGDQARCQSFDVDAQKQTYYWRLVVGVDYVQNNDYPSSDYHCILLSQTDCDTLSDEPTAGDEIVQFGNRTDKSRQSAILLSAYDINAKSAPCIIQYDGIDSYDLTDKEVQRWSPGNNVLKGKVTIEPDSEGLRNFSELPEVIKEVEDYSDENLKKLSFSNTNLLRNSGFYGDTKSKAILGDTMMSTDTELYSPSLEYWSVSNAVAYPSDANEEGAETTPAITDSKSGYYCKITNGYISQIIGTALVDEDYIISFRGKGDFTIGFVGNTEKVTLSDTSTRHIIRCKARTTTVNAILRIEGTGSICEIMLERGNIPSNTWNRSTLDASKELSRFHNLEYLTQAIQEGSTTMMGGLILSNILMLGNYVDGVMKQVTSGISGTYNQGDDVSYWAGGSLENAIYTATKLLKNPFYQFTEEEKKNLANAIITHGGTAIFNEAIVRGTVYATNGIFTGEVNATSGTFNNVVINENAIIKGKFNKVTQHITTENFSDFFYHTKEKIWGNTGADIGEALPTRLLSWGDIIYIDSINTDLLNNNQFIVFPALLPFIDDEDELRHRKIYGYHRHEDVDVRLTAEDVRELINREFMIFNNTTTNIGITSALLKKATTGNDDWGNRTINPYLDYELVDVDVTNDGGNINVRPITNQAEYIVDYSDSQGNLTGFSIGSGEALWLKYVMSETRVEIASEDIYSESIALVGNIIRGYSTEEESEKQE